MAARALTLALFGIALAASMARAQVIPEARWIDPPCTPTWWDRAALLSSLRIELRAIGVAELEAVDVEPGPSGGERERAITITPLLACDGDASTIEVELTIAGDAPRTRTIELADVVPTARTRTLALAIASTVAGAIVATERAEASVAAELPPERLAPVTPEPPEPERARVLPPSIEPRASNTPAPRARPSATLGIDVEADWLTSSESALVGPRLLGVLRPIAGEPLAIWLAARATFGSARDELGEVRASWIDGTIGAAVEADVSPLRIIAGAGVAVGAVMIEGIAGRPGVIAQSQAAPTVAVVLSVGAELEIVRGFAIAIDAHADALLVGLDARAATRGSIALRDLVPGIRLGIRVDL